MSNFVKEEGVFLTGVVFLAALVFGALQIQQRAQRIAPGENVASTTPVVITATSAAPVEVTPPTLRIQPAVVTPTSETKVTTPAPRIRNKEVEYDDE